VVGLTPVIEPGKKFSYASQVVIESKMGTMRGHFRSIDLKTLEENLLEIAPFLLVAENSTPKVTEVIPKSIYH